jgi:hypothetical protein
MEVKKLTKDDPKFNKKILTRIEEVFARAEVCKKQIDGQFKSKSKGGFHAIHDESNNQAAVSKIMEDLSMQTGAAEQATGSIWNSSKPLFGNDGGDVPNTEITMPRSTAGKISKPMKPKEQT